MQCPKCGYDWIPRIESPKCCPDCKTRLRHHKAAGPLAGVKPTTDKVAALRELIQPGNVLHSAPASDLIDTGETVLDYDDI